MQFGIFCILLAWSVPIFGYEENVILENVAGDDQVNHLVKRDADVPSNFPTPSLYLRTDGLKLCCDLNITNPKGIQFYTTWYKDGVVEKEDDMPFSQTQSFLGVPCKFNNDFSTFYCEIKACYDVYCPEKLYSKPKRSNSYKPSIGENICLIDGKCYSKDTINPKNKNEVCIPQLSQTSWTDISEPTTITTTTTTTTTTPTTTTTTPTTTTTTPTTTTIPSCPFTSCWISGKCYQANTPHPTNSLYQCKPNRNRYNWSNLGVRPPNNETWAREVCRNRKFELCLVLDTSGSIGLANFQIVKAAVRSTVDVLDISSYKTQVSLITYSNSAFVRFYLNQIKDKATMLSTISALPYPGGGTNTHLALNEARTSVFTPAHGSRNLPKVMIIYTDGASSTPALTQAESNAAKNSGIKTFSVGVGSSLNAAELEVMASDPPFNYVFTVNTFQGLPSVQYVLAALACEMGEL